MNLLAAAGYFLGTVATVDEMTTMNRARTSWFPFLAAALMLAASVPYLVSSARWFMAPGVIAKELGGGKVWPWVGIIILVPFWAPLIIGAICAFARKAFGLAFVCALAPSVLTIFLRPWGWEDVGIGYLVGSSSVFMYGALTSLHFAVTAAAALLLLFSRKTFREQESSAERLYGPPKNWRDMVP